MSASVQPAARSALRPDAQPSARRTPPSLVARHQPALDGLRGLAVGAVIAFHIGRIDLLYPRGGWLGVDVFFVLSGFLITALMLAEHDRATSISLRAFWGRRGRRLLPALIVLLTTICTVSLVRDPTAARHDVGHATWLTLGYVSNWGQALPARGTAIAPPFRHLWSLAVEEQFYVVWPPVAACVLWRWGARAVGVLAAVAAALSATGMAYGEHLGAGLDRLYFGSDTHVQPIAVGAALAAGLHLATPSVRQRLAGPSVVTGWLGMAVLGYVVMRADSLDPRLYRGGFLLIALAAGAVVVAVLLAPAGTLARALSLRPLGWLGRRSYALYLWHWPVICWFNPTTVGTARWPLQLLRLALTAVLAETSHRIVENPIRRGALLRLPPGVRWGAYFSPALVLGFAGALVLA